VTYYTDKQKLDRCIEIIDALINLPPSSNDTEQAMVTCPYHEPFHFHGDGCPACVDSDQKEEDYPFRSDGKAAVPIKEMLDEFRERYKEIYEHKS